MKTRALLATATWLAVAGSTLAAGVKDGAKMFSPEAVRRADAALAKMESSYQVPVTIETIESVPGRPTDRAELRRALNAMAVEHDNKLGNHGVYMLLSKDDKAMSNVATPKWLTRHFPEAAKLDVVTAFQSEFKKGDFDAGLAKGIAQIESSLATGKAEAGAGWGLQAASKGKGAPAIPNAGPAIPKPNVGGGGGGMGTLLVIGLVIVAGLFVVRLLSGMARGMSGGNGQQQAMGQNFRGAPGYGPQPGPGGMGGYGGGVPQRGGGGFMSGLMGGLGGAVAGNWLYDKFGRQHGGTPGSDVGGSPGAGSYDPTQNDVTAGEGGGQEGWGDNSGGGVADSGGGGADWGGDAGGGGGDWGGGGGGGGGDW